MCTISSFSRRENLFSWRLVEGKFLRFLSFVDVVTMVLRGSQLQNFSHPCGNYHAISTPFGWSSFLRSTYTSILRSKCFATFLKFSYSYENMFSRWMRKISALCYQPRFQCYQCLQPPFSAHQCLHVPFGAQLAANWYPGAQGWLITQQAYSVKPSLVILLPWVLRFKVMHTLWIVASRSCNLVTWCFGWYEWTLECILCIAKPCWQIFWEAIIFW